MSNAAEIRLEWDVSAYGHTFKPTMLKAQSDCAAQ